MFYWNTRKLADQIKSGELQETDKKNYYLATSILLTAFMYMAIAEGSTNAIATLIEGVLLIAIVIMGINITFSTNKGNDGSEYIARITMLSLPILIKVFVITIALALITGIIAGVIIGLGGGEWGDPSDWIWVLMSAVIQVIYFWRVNVHLAYINT